MRMRGFVLAAGFGTRLRPLTDHLPKALVPFAGIPLLEHAVAFLEKNDVAPIGINAHYLPQTIEGWVRDHQAKYSLFVELPEIRGTGGALDVAREFLSGDDTFLIANADIVTRFDIKSKINSFEASDDICRLIAFPPSGRGTILYDPQTMTYMGTPGKDEVSGNVASADFIGITLYRKEFLELITGEDFSIIPVWKRAQNHGMRVSVAIADDGFWRDLGTPLALAQAHFDLIDGLLPPFPPSCAGIDFQRKGRFPEVWEEERKALCGPYCWIDDPSFEPQPGESRLVVFNEGKRYNRHNNNGLLITPWGEIGIDD